MVTCFQVIREVQLRSLIGLHGKKLNHEEHEEHEDEKAPKSERAAFYVFTVFIEYFLLLRALRALRGSISSRVNQPGFEVTFHVRPENRPPFRPFHGFGLQIGRFT